MTNYTVTIQTVMSHINSFPKSKNWKPFLTAKNGRKVFFDLFIRKYGLDGRQVEYANKDVLRRITLIEFFDYFLKTFDMVNGRSKDKLVVESLFHIMVLVKKGKYWHEALELLSFHPKKKTASV